MSAASREHREAMPTPAQHESREPRAEPRTGHSAEPRAERHRERPQRERKPDHRSDQGSGRRERRHDRGDESSPVGLGDHVPAFLARSPR